MTSYYNCGVYGPDGRIKTKQRLKELLATHPEGVYFDGASIFTTEIGYSATAIPEGLILSVVGPDPHTERKWYATIELRNGELKVA